LVEESTGPLGRFIKMERVTNSANCVVKEIDASPISVGREH